MIQLDQLTKYYGKSRGIINISLNIDRGEVFGFIGPNGAGKSTTIRILLSLIRPTSGRALINGQECTAKNKGLKRIVGYVPSEVNYYDDMRAKQLFDYSARFYNVDATKRINELADRLNFDPTKKIDSLSYGNKKKVAIIGALLHSPECLILDEPTSGLDPLMQTVFFDILKEEQRKGTTILFSSHVLGEVQKACDRVAIIKEGRLIKVETIDSLRKTRFRQVALEYESPDSAEMGLEVMTGLTGVMNAKVEGRNVEFLYGGDINTLLGVLAGRGMDNVLIQEPALEDIFLHYYGEGGEKDEFVSA